ncbi:MAG: DUF2332 family protein [Pseudomonadota bacterium]
MTLQAAFNTQALACEGMGSPFMGRLLRMLCAHWPGAGPLHDKLASFEGDIGPSGHSLPLRVASGLHALVLTNAAPALAAVYPPHEAEDAALTAAVLEALTAQESFLRDWIEIPPQTNEVRRSAALIAGARVAVSHFDLPIALSELGASGGLNMMWDHYAIDIDGQRFGPAVPTAVFTPDWVGPPPPDVAPVIAARAGVDLNPLDPARADHMLRLTAYIWPDQPERLALTRAAGSIVTTPPERGDAVTWLSGRLAAAPAGHLHLIQHTVAWQYFPAAAQAHGRVLIEAAGAQATAQRPLAWLSVEADSTGARGALIALRLWPGDLRLTLGRSDFHGRWINWSPRIG